MSDGLFQFFINFVSNVAAAIVFALFFKYFGKVNAPELNPDYRVLRVFNNSKLQRATLVALSVVVAINAIVSSLDATLVYKFFRTQADHGGLANLILLHSVQGAIWGIASFAIYSGLGAFVVLMARRRFDITEHDLPACFTAGTLAGAIIVPIGSVFYWLFGEHIFPLHGASVGSLFDHLSFLSLVCLLVPAAAMAFGFGLLVGYVATGMASRSEELQLVYKNRYRMLMLGGFLVAVFFMLVFRFNPNSFLRQALSYGNTMKIWGAYAVALLVGFVLGLESYESVLKDRFIVQYVPFVALNSKPEPETQTESVEG